MVLRGLGPGNHPGLNRDATFYNFIGVLFVLLLRFFNLKSSLAGLWKSCSGWSLGWTETTRASPSARTSWFYIVQVYFHALRYEIITCFGTFLPTEQSGGEEPGAFLTTADLPRLANTLGNLRLEDIMKARFCS